MNDAPTPSFDSKWNSTIALLERCLGAMQAIAPVASARQLREILPQSENNFPQLVLVELIKIDMAVAADLGLQRTLDFYLAEFDREMPIESVPADLVLEEIQVVRESGIEPDLQEYLRRFPHLAGILSNLADDRDQVTYGRLSATGGSPPELPIGERVSEFRILRRVGRGAFANVYLALQESMQRLVALKVSRGTSEEPQTLSQLDHPNIVRVFDERNQSDPPLRLLYMQFVGGGTLADCLKKISDIPIENRQGRHVLESVSEHLKVCGLEPPQQSDVLVANFDWPSAVAWIGMQLAEGLDYAHRQGVVHRDVKPANIILAADATPKLADFNVSYSGIVGRAGAAAFFGGSLAYMSPEQLGVAGALADGTQAGELDGRSDLYSLGVVLWETLHGKRPWQMWKVPVSWIDAIQMECGLRNEPLPSNQANAMTMKQTGYRVVESSIRRCLSRDPEGRPQTGKELAKALRLALHPQASKRLYPEHSDKPHWMAKFPPWFFLLAAALIPNLIAAVFNVVYNGSQIISKYPELWAKFFRVTTLMNLVLFPLGIAVVLWLILSYTRNLRKKTVIETKDDHEIPSYWNLGHHVALVCGGLWLTAGLAFPLSLLVLYKQFHWADALHFFSSLTICGGVAMVYPFFAITLLNLNLYYPQSVVKKLADPGFSVWSLRLRRMARVYLLAAAAIPLFALALLVLKSDVPRHYLLATILTTAVGFAASFFAVQSIEDFAHDLEDFMVDKLSRTGSRE